jgi:hypothetical protein
MKAEKQRSASWLSNISTSLTREFLMPLISLRRLIQLIQLEVNGLESSIPSRECRGLLCVYFRRRMDAMTVGML